MLLPEDRALFLKRNYSIPVFEETFQSADVPCSVELHESHSEILTVDYHFWLQIRLSSYPYGQLKSAQQTTNSVC